jgi:Phospholipid methyltransferase
LGRWRRLSVRESLSDLGQNLTPLPHPRDEGQFVKTGVYGLVRHPMYGGVIYLALAYASWQMSWVHLVGAIDSLRRPEFLTITLRGLGTRHLKDGVLPHHYPMVGNSFRRFFYNKPRFRTSQGF